MEGLRLEPVRDVFQKLHEHLLWNFSGSEIDHFCWLAIGGATGKIITDSAAVVKFFAKKNDSSVPYPINLSPDHLSGVFLSHSAG